MADEGALRCPACGGEEIEVTRGRASACTPMPPIEALRCVRCGNAGTRLRLGREVRVRWEREAAGA